MINARPIARIATKPTAATAPAAAAPAAPSDLGTGVTATPVDPADALADALASIHDAAAVRVPGWMALITGLASARPDGVGATIDWLVAHRAELERAYAGGRDGRLGLATLPPEMQYPRELGFLDRTRDDHGLRDRYLFADLVGHRTFFQSAVYAMTGIELPPRHAEMLEQIGNANLNADRRAWPMAVTRRIAARGGGYAASVAGGMAMMSSPVLAGAAAADCARFLRRTAAEADDGRPVDDVVADALAARQRVMGFGRPVVGYDERVPVMRAVLARYGRDRLPYVTLLDVAETSFRARKGLHATSAAWAAAILTDFGMTPEQVQAVCNFWVSVTVYAQAVYGGEHGLVTP